MNNISKRKDATTDDSKPKRVKKDCLHGDKCYRRNPAHLREFSHPHLEAILNAYKGNGSYPIPDKFEMDKHLITEQLDIIVEKQLYNPIRNKTEAFEASSSSNSQPKSTPTTSNNLEVVTSSSIQSPIQSHKFKERERSPKLGGKKIDNMLGESSTTQNLNVKQREKSKSPSNGREKPEDNENKEPYRPIVEPTRRVEDFLKVVAPKNKMADKHKAAAPYYMFYTTITSAKETHRQPYSITFLEILDRSLGELKCSLQINFMVEAGWLLAQYYFAGYSEKKLTILYGEKCPVLAKITEKKPHVTAHMVNMSTPFGKHHTKMMVLCYEDGSVRVVISTANLYIDDWENRTQALWFSPRCPPLPSDALPIAGESPTMFKRSLLKYLQRYNEAASITTYINAVKKCDFSHINVFLIASVPGSHFDGEWGMTRVGTLLRQHCAIPGQQTREWPLMAQASSLGSYGNKANLWLTGDFLHNFTKIKEQPQTLTSPPPLKLIYPSLENVRQSHDGLLGGGCLPYAATAHCKQTWLVDYLYQWRSRSISRDKAMPHIKSYTRVSPDHKMAAYFLLTSGNVSKAAWGTINKGDGALRIMSYEAGVLFLPKFVINQDLFPLEGSNRLILPYDVPPIKYTPEMSPWVSDYLYD